MWVRYRTAHDIPNLKRTVIRAISGAQAAGLGLVDNRLGIAVVRSEHNHVIGVFPIAEALDSERLGHTNMVSMAVWGGLDFYRAERRTVARVAIVERKSVLET